MEKYKREENGFKETAAREKIIITGLREEEKYGRKCGVNRKASRNSRQQEETVRRDGKKTVRESRSDDGASKSVQCVCLCVCVSV